MPSEALSPGFRVHTREVLADRCALWVAWEGAKSLPQSTMLLWSEMAVEDVFPANGGEAWRAAYTLLDVIQTQSLGATDFVVEANIRSATEHCLVVESIILSECGACLCRCSHRFERHQQGGLST